MASVMTKRGSLDNVVTYEHFCDDVADIVNIPQDQITLGSIAIALKNGNTEGLEVYIANSDKEWVPLMSGGSSGGGGVDFSDLAHICEEGEYDSETGIPTVSDPIENKFYFTPAGNEPNNLFKEWIYVNGEWELFGSVDAPAATQSDWNENNSENMAYIKNRPFFIESADTEREKIIWSHPIYMTSSDFLIENPEMLQEWDFNFPYWFEEGYDRITLTLGSYTTYNFTLSSNYSNNYNTLTITGTELYGNDTVIWTKQRRTGSNIYDLVSFYLHLENYYTSNTTITLSVRNTPNDYSIMPVPDNLLSSNVVTKGSLEKTTQSFAWNYISYPNTLTIQRTSSQGVNTEVDMPASTFNNGKGLGDNFWFNTNINNDTSPKWRLKITDLNSSISKNYIGQKVNNEYVFTTFGETSYAFLQIVLYSENNDGVYDSIRYTFTRDSRHLPTADTPHTYSIAIATQASNSIFSEKMLPFMGNRYITIGKTRLTEERLQRLLDLNISSDGTSLTLGNTTITETQLQNLLSLSDATGVGF